jgi:Mg2+ and Co2+ transporter CorA
MATQMASEEKQANVNLITCGKLTRTYIERPTPKEVEYLAQSFSFHPLNLDDVLSRVQRPKIDEYTFIPSKDFAMPGWQLRLGFRGKRRCC